MTGGGEMKGDPRGGEELRVKTLQLGPVERHGSLSKRRTTGWNAPERNRCSLNARCIHSSLICVEGRQGNNRTYGCLPSIAQSLTEYRNARLHCKSICQ